MSESEQDGATEKAIGLGRYACPKGFEALDFRVGVD